MLTTTFASLILFCICVHASGIDTCKVDKYTERQADEQTSSELPASDASTNIVLEASPSLYMAYYEALVALGSFLIVLAVAKPWQSLQPRGRAAKATEEPEVFSGVLEDFSWCQRPAFSPCEKMLHPKAKKMKSRTPSESRSCPVAVASDENAISSKAEDYNARPIQPPVLGFRSECEDSEALAAAIRSGRAAELPRLLDAVYARVAAKIGNDDERALQEMATRQLLSCLRACTSWRCFRDALAAYDHMAMRIGPACAAVWSILLYAAVEERAFHRCAELYTHLCTLSCPSGHDIVNMTRFFVNQRNIKGFLDMLRQAEDRAVSIDSKSRNKALSVSTGARAIDIAEAVWEARICREPLDVVAYNTLIQGYARCGCISRCFDLYHEMQFYEINPSQITFGILLNACNGTNDLKRARQVFEDLRTSGLHLNVVHYTTFMKSLVSSGELSDAADVLAWMLESPDTKPDVVTYSMLVKAHADGGNVVAAVDVLKEMTKQGIKADLVILNIVLTGCCVRRMDAAEIFRVFQWLTEEGLQPTTVTLSILLKALVKSEAWAAALDMIERAHANWGVWPEGRLYAQLARALAIAGQSSKALDTYMLMVQAASLSGNQISGAINSRLLQICTSTGETRAAHFIYRKVAHSSGFISELDVSELRKFRDSRRYSGNRV